MSVPAPLPARRAPRGPRRATRCGPHRPVKPDRPNGPRPMWWQARRVDECGLGQHRPVERQRRLDPPISVSSSARGVGRAPRGDPAHGRSACRSGVVLGATRSPASTAVSTRMPGPAGIAQRVMRPGDGAKTRAGSSAEIRTSIAWLVGRGARRRRHARVGKRRPAASLNCSTTRSIPDTISVTGCSTWSRVFTSRNQNAPSRSHRNSTSRRSGVRPRHQGEPPWRGAASVRLRQARRGASSISFWWRRWSSIAFAQAITWPVESPRSWTSMCPPA